MQIQILIPPLTPTPLGKRSEFMHLCISLELWYASDEQNSTGSEPERGGGYGKFSDEHERKEALKEACLRKKPYHGLVWVLVRSLWRPTRFNVHCTSCQGYKATDHASMPSSCHPRSLPPLVVGRRDPAVFNSQANRRDDSWDGPSVTLDQE